MAQTIFLFADTSSDIGLDGMGGGWVAVCDGIIAYGNADCPDGQEQSRRILLDRAFDFAVRRFPDADEILVTGPKDDVIRLPWGEALDDDVLVGLDRTGIGAYCEARGIRLTARWMNGNLPGPGADVFALGVARVLAIQARRGVELWGEVVHELGWRSHLVTLFGGPAFNHGIDGRGLTPGKTAEFAGISPEAVDGYVTKGWLTAVPDGRIAYASAIRLRDGLEGDGTVRFDEEDFGDAHLDLHSEAPDATLCVDYVANPRGMGVGVSLRQDSSFKAWAKRYAPVADEARATGLRAALLAIAFRLQDLEGCRIVDVVTGDAWLAKILSGEDDDRQSVIEATGFLRSTVCDLGVSIRPRHLFMPYGRPDSLGELHGLARASCLLAHVGAVGTSACHESDRVLGDGEGLLFMCEVQATLLRRYRPRQVEVVQTLFTDCGVEPNIRDIFCDLVRSTVASYRGVIVDLHPFLPGHLNGEIAVLTPVGARPIGRDFDMSPTLKERWVHWHARFDRARERNPVVRLRERILDVERGVDLNRWEPHRYRSVIRWVDGWQGHTPFHLPPLSRVRIETEIRRMVEECGGWPWNEPGSVKSLRKVRSRKPVATVARIGRAALVEYAS